MEFTGCTGSSLQDHGLELDKAGQGWTGQSCLPRTLSAQRKMLQKHPFPSEPPGRCLVALRDVALDAQMTSAPIQQKFWPWVVHGKHWVHPLGTVGWVFFNETTLMKTYCFPAQPKRKVHQTHFVLWKGREVFWALPSEVEVVGHHCSNQLIWKTPELCRCHKKSSSNYFLKRFSQTSLFFFLFFCFFLFSFWLFLPLS